MDRTFRSSMAFILAGGALIGMAGCDFGSQGVDTAQPVSGSQQTTSSAKPDGGAEKWQARKSEGEITTPTQRLDTKQLIDVVKEEVKGGESTEGPTPYDYLWHAVQAGADQGRAADRHGPGRAGTAQNKVNVPASNPADQGQVRAGPAALFRPAGLAGRHGQLRHLPQSRQGLDRPDRRSRPASRGRPAAAVHPTVLNTVYGKTMFWDGRAPSLEGQAQGPIQNPIEMGKQSYKEIVERLRTIPGYHEQFQKVFGTNVTLDGMAKAIATFERVAALSGNSDYDQYNGGRHQGPVRQPEAGHGPLRLAAQSLDDEFKTDVVLQKAKCTLCHVGSISPTSSSTTWALAGTKDAASSPTSAAGRSSRSGPRTMRASARSRRRRSATSSTPLPTCTTAA